MVQVTSALLAIAAAAAGLAGATETPAPTLARTLAYFKPAAADEAAAPPPALSKLTQAVTPAPKEVPASKEEPSAVEAYLERAKAFAVEHGKVLGGTLLALVAAALALGGKTKKEVEANGSRVAAPAAPVEVTTPKEPAAPPPPTPAQVKQERKELLGPVRKSTCVRPAWRYYLLFWPPEGVDAARECLASSHEAS